jgi:signal peptidase I
MHPAQEDTTSMPGNAPSSTFGSHALAWPNNPGSRSPLIAALLSLLVSGLGQVYVGRPARGTAWFLAILALEAAVLYALLHQPRFWMIALSITAWLAATLFQIGEAAVLARRATHYQLQRYNKWYVYLALFAVSMALNVATCLALTRDAATPAGVHSIDSSSMQPAIRRGDRFVADRNYYRHNQPARGDVAVYLHPRRPETLYVKRIVALAGDRVAIRDGRAIVNGFALEEPYAILGDAGAFYNQAREITVPDGHVFVLGDNRANSFDSRAANDHGPVPVENLRARATDIAWSRTLSRIGRWIGTP